MRVPQKWQYALRGIFELARRNERGPIKVSEIAEAQDIPPRFLEVILNQLKREGIVDSRRGTEGGYMLIKSPLSITVGEVIRSLDGELGPLRGKNSDSMVLEFPSADGVLSLMWKEAWESMWKVYEETTFQSLLDEAGRQDERYVPSYAI